MRNSIVLLSILFVFTAFASPDSEKDKVWLGKALTIANYQLKQAAKKYTPELNPRSILPDGTIKYAHYKDWTCGFFPGSLWYMYEFTQDTFFLRMAEKYTEALDSVQYFTHTHDLGFMLYCSYGNAYRLTQKEEYKRVLEQGAKSLATRYNTTIGCIRSWDFGNWQYPVIVDNMMNLEYLLWAAENTDDNNYKNIAISHSLKTKENHYRDDYSCFHVISYDPITGLVEKQDTHQGYSTESTWARGQAWGLYGFTVLYRETGDTRFLDQAKNIAQFLISHPRMPKNGIPYWDFDAPDIPKAPRDASAAAITASALIDLSDLDSTNNQYFAFAERILMNLSTEEYLAEKGEYGYFILKHSVGAFPFNNEIDTPINYGDYYYLEGIIKYCNKKKINIQDFSNLN